nr:ATP-dependent zinc metalloprotease FTSH 7, chloroplastic [Tanacetum cinerariifolium]
MISDTSQKLAFVKLQYAHKVVFPEENKTALARIPETPTEPEPLSAARCRVHHNSHYKCVVRVILREMEGFDRNFAVIVLGATNHVDVLDQTLRQSGIFDCVVMI